MRENALSFEASMLRILIFTIKFVKILDGYGIEVAIQTIWNPENTSYVVTSRETELIVNEIHNHKTDGMSSY